MSLDALDHADPFEDEHDPSFDDHVAACGYDPVATPVDTLMAAPIAMGLRVAESMHS